MGGGINEKIRHQLHIPSNIIDFEDFSMDNASELKKMFEKKRIVYCGGWGFRVHNLTEKYRNFFIQEYTLLPDFIQNNSFCSFFSHLKDFGCHICGVHIRRGDYKEWQGGKFYFGDDIYISYIKKIKKLLNDNVYFIIFSNETPLEIPADIENICTISKEDWFIDQYIMSQCDYLIGPPSTFTMWASYIGKAKYFHISSSDNISINQFRTCLG